MYQMIYYHPINGAYVADMLYDPRDDDLLVREPDVHFAVNEPGSLSLTIDNDHPVVTGPLAKLTGRIDLLQDGDIIYTGRIIRDKKDFNNSRRVETEGMLAALNDSLIAPFVFPDDFVDDPNYQAAAATGNVVQFFLNWVVSLHNAQVDSIKQITLGTVTVTALGNTFSCSSAELVTSWSVIKEKLIGSLEGYILQRYSSAGALTIDYVSDFSLTNTQTIDFGENLLDLTSEIDATGVYTAIYPVGKDGLTILSEPDGAVTPDISKSGYLIYSLSGRNQYGQITKALKWDWCENSTTLKNLAAEALSGTGILMTSSITVKACDLHCDDALIASFRVGRYVTIHSTPHGINQNFALVELNPDILDPGNTIITLGSTTKTQTELNQSSYASASAKIENQGTKTEALIDEVTASTSQQITEAVQTAQSIIFSAMDNYVSTGDFTTYQQTVSSSLAVLSSSIDVNIRQVTSQLSQVGNDLQKQISDITKYFRFTADGLLIGETGNEVLLRLDNDVIQFLRANVAGLWMDEDGLHSDSVSTDRLLIGNAEIVTENGRLTLRKAVNS